MTAIEAEATTDQTAAMPLRGKVVAVTGAASGIVPVRQI